MKMETLSIPSSSTQSPAPGGWPAITYILGNESFEKLASMSLIANITVYLRTKYNLTGIFLVNIVTIWSGTTNVSSIAGAIISDAYLGRFLTLLFGTVSSLVGMMAMTMTAAAAGLRPVACKEEDVDSACHQPYKWQLAFLFTGLGLISVGAGGIRPCNIAFGADQFNTSTEKGKAQLESFFNWWYLSFTIALVIALTIVIYIQTNVSWVIGFAIPTVCLAVSITIFLIGRRRYVYKVPMGNVFVDMAKVAVAAFRKRNVDLDSCDGASFYDLSFVGEEKIEKTERFKCLDKACVIADVDAELDSAGTAVNEWRLCRVNQVEALKCFLGIFPVWVSGVGCFLVMDQQSTFGVLQGIQMNRSIGKNFTMPPAWMGITSMIALSIWILLYERVYIPITKKTELSRLKMEQRILLGIISAIMCMVVAAVVEKRRRTLSLNHGSFVSPLHVAALLPQFILAGLTEALAAVALMEFFTLRLPESLRSVAGAVFFLSLSVASYLSSLVVTIIHSTTGKTPWLGGHDLNYNKLDHYYSIIAALGVVDLIYFCWFGRKYVEAAGKPAAPGSRHRELEQGSIA